MNRRQMNVTTLAAGAAVIGAFALWASAGDPTPPPGPVTSTMKTLDQVQPRIPIPASTTPTTQYDITQPGSYYLTGDRHASGHGIVITSGDVTLDLAGYALVGTDTGSFDGIVISGVANVEIRNGTVRDFGDEGILGALSSTKDTRVLNARIISNGGDGISLSGVGALIKNCTVAENAQRGIFVQKDSNIIGCNVRQNGGNRAIDAVHGTSIIGNTIYFNSGDGIHAANACVISDNMVLDNSGTYGIYAATGCVITNNTQHNSETGYLTSAGCVVIGNVAVANDRYGFNIGPGFFDQNAAYNNNQAGGFGNVQTHTACVVGQNYAP